MRAAVLGSLQWFSQRDPIRRIAFALDPKLREEPLFYEVDVVLDDGVRYTYGFEIDDDRVRGEWRHAYPKCCKQVWFDRVDDQIDFPGEGLRVKKLELARRTRLDTLFLSVAAQFNHEQLLPVFNWFRDNLWLRADGSRAPGRRLGNYRLRQGSSLPRRDQPTATPAQG